MAIADIKKGDTKRYKFTFTQNTGTEEAPIWTPVDIATWMIFFTLKTNADDTDAVAAAQVKYTAGDDALDDPVNGTMYVVLPSDVSNTITPGKYHYDFQRVIPGVPPDVRTLDQDVVEVLQDVTEATA